MSQDSRSSGSTPKPNYNKHFPRSFLLNYGEALQDLPDEKILARLKHWNCEWLSRPNIAMSEMAATLKDNWEQISRFKGTVFTNSFVNQLESFCEPIMPALRRLDNKDRYCHDPPDKDDILDVIEAVHKDDKTEELFMEAFNACGPVLMMAIHVIAFNCLLHNPDALADQSVKNAATDALRSNPTKQNVNQYLIDAILQKRRTVQRSKGNLWDRSLYSAGTESPAKHNEHNRRRPLDTQQDDDACARTSGASSTPRRRLSNLPSFARPPQPTDTPRGKRPAQQSRKRPSLSPVPEHDQEDQPTQLYTRAAPDKRQRTTDRRRAAENLPTMFDDGQEEEEQRPRAKNKRPPTGPATAKNRQPREVRDTTSDESDEEDQPPKRPNTPEPKQKPKSRKRPAVVVADDSDMDDDQLGITPRTPPESPFYRGHREKTSAAQITKPCQPSTSKKNTMAERRKTKEPAPNPKAAETNLDTQMKKKKNKKNPHRPTRPCRRAGQVVCQLEQGGTKIQVNSDMLNAHPRCVYKRSALIQCVQ